MTEENVSGEQKFLLRRAGEDQGRAPPGRLTLSEVRGFSHVFESPQRRAAIMTLRSCPRHINTMQVLASY